jgi:hypothetical protein
MKSLRLLLAKLSLTLLLATALTHGTTAYAESGDFTAAELDQMLAPIALYPDTILSHVLIASTYPLEVVQADRWISANPDLKAEAAVAAVEDQDWDPSVKALVAFPQILDRMSEDLAWTQRLGDAFLADEAAVMDAIQNLRNKAYASGSLDKLEHVKVQREKEIIIIEPAVERVVYVPVYDTRVVYGNWWWSDYPPVYWHYPSHYTFVGGFYWGPRIYVGPSFYFSSFHWHRRHVVYVDRGHGHRHHFHNGRSIANYSGARQWRHNPTHRRGVAYYNDRVSRDYGSQRQSYRDLRQQRGTQPQWRREQQQANQSRREQQQAGPRTNIGRENLRPESDRVRERLGNRDAGGSNSPRSTSTHDKWRQERTMHNNNTVTTAQQARPQRGSETSTTIAPNGASDRRNTTLPSRSDPRPTADRRGQDRTTVTPAARSSKAAPVPAPERAQRPTHGRESNTLREMRTQRDNSVRESSRTIDRATRHQNVGRPAGGERAQRAERQR